MKLLKWLAVTVISVASANSFAGHVTANEVMQQYKAKGYYEIKDNYIGAGHNDDINGKSYIYDVDTMFISRVGTTLNIDIFTAFYNNIGQNGIDLGDLFLAADVANNDTGSSPWNPTTNSPYYGDQFSSTSNSNTGTNWNYAYSLGDTRDTRSGVGELRDFNSNQLVDTANGRNYREGQAVTVNNNGSYNSYGTSSWNVDNSYSYAKRVGNTNNGYGKVSFSFDVTGTALATANQIAFRWSMTCANDIIEGLASFAPQPGGGSTTVPEPSTVVLMLLAMAGLIYRRKENS